MLQQCNTHNGRRQNIMRARWCVYCSFVSSHSVSNEPCGFFTDTVFAELYPEAFATESVRSGSSSTQRSSPIVTDNSTTGSFSGDSQSSSSDGSMARTKIIYIKIAVVVVVPVFVVWILVCRHTSISKSDLQLPLTTPRGKRTDHAEHHLVAPGIISAPPPSGYLVYDVRNDELLIAHRFPLGEITIIMQIASGGFGAVYLGTLTRRQFAIKRQVQSMSKTNTELCQFMNEMRSWITPRSCALWDSRGQISSICH